MEGAGVKKPDAIYVNGFLTVNGEKMSKSRGTFIKARTYLDHLDPEYLRYYFAYKSSAGVDDFDLDTEDFQNRINADLIGKWINIASRSSKFIREHFENNLSADVDKDLMETFDSGAPESNVSIKSLSTSADKLFSKCSLMNLELRLAILIHFPIKSAFILF